MADIGLVPAAVTAEAPDIGDLLLIVPEPVYWSTPPQVRAGTVWGAEEFNKYIVDNMTFLFYLITGIGLHHTYATNEVLVGTADGGLTGLPIPEGGLVVGGSTSVQVLHPGSDGQIITAKNGRINWETVNVSIDFNLLLALS